MSIYFLFFYLILAGNSGDDSEVERDGGHAYTDRVIARSKSNKKQLENDPLKEKAVDKKKGKTDKSDKNGKNDKTLEKQNNDKGSEIVSHQLLPSWTTGTEATAVSSLVSLL